MKIYGFVHNRSATSSKQTHSLNDLFSPQKLRRLHWLKLQAFLYIPFTLSVASLFIFLLQYEHKTMQITLLVTYRFEWSQSVNNLCLLPAHAQRRRLHGDAADVSVRRGKSTSARADLSLASALLPLVTLSGKLELYTTVHVLGSCRCRILH